MAFLQKIMEHFQNLVILSDFSIKLIGICLVLTAILSLYYLFFKSQLYEKYMPWLGVAIRVLMFIGFTIEFAHHAKISPLMDYSEGKEYAMVQLSKYVFFAYILVVGVYDVLTIGINKFRGFFYSFDIAMVSIPVIYAFTSAAIYLPKEGFDLTSLLYLVLLIIMVLMIFLFFQVYWKQNIKWYVIFFLVAIPEVSILSYLKSEFPYALAIFLLLLGLYECSRHIVEHIKVKSTKALWNGLKLCSSTFILVVVIFGLTFCGINPIRSNESSTVYMLFNKSIKLATVQEAEKAARTALGDDKSKFALNSVTSMDFYNFFYIILGDYKVDVSEGTGKVSQIHNSNPKKAKEPGTLKLHEVKDKTIYFLKQCGYTYEAKKTEMNIQEKDNKYEVVIKNKFSNGKSDNLEDSNNLEISWFKNGKLSDMLGFGNLLDLKDYKEIKINENVIEKSISTWYGKLGEKVPTYALDGLSGFISYCKYNTLNIICDNGNYLMLDIKDGTVRSFQRDRRSRVEFDKALYEKYQDKVLELYEKIIPNNEKSKYILNNKDNGYASYSFINENEGVISEIDISLDNRGKLSSYGQFSYGNRRVYNGKEFKVSQNQALKLVTNKYKFFNIYTKRAKLIEELQPSGDTKLKWMVVIMPYMSSEHHIYFVDVNNGEINALQNYRGGLRNE
ncbi:hypothetical protein G9F71_002750 [Clostridium sp. FP2]|uniref:hypothetical protein n=1 Tax=Clostridium sp. FP2 TaxID=2724481 RepID=UPI0013E97462|nr:hypothetical protein [Clostridium sp. FP2]MBZ9621785.1 hypothetical protein [Clostridium sp. FP2]